MNGSSTFEFILDRRRSHWLENKRKEMTKIPYDREYIASGPHFQMGGFEQDVSSRNLSFTKALAKQS
jgi:hypothetical protein